MDEDDSQDELINKTTSSKGKRAALWAISDDSDDAVEGSEEGDSESGEEEEEEDQLDGEEDDEGEEEDYSDDEEEEEEDSKASEGVVGGTSADLGGLSSDDDTEKCPICLNSFSSQPVATPESCEHYFCLDCILEWAKNATSCPVDRIVFSNIYLRKCYGGKVQKMITVQKPVKEGQEDTVDLDLEQTSCEVCGGSDREDRLLLCDGCDAGYHMECLTPPLDAVPVEEWFCPECEANNRNSRDSAEELSETDSLHSSARPTTSRPRPPGAGPTRAIARTQQSERVRASVNRHRITQARTAQLAPRYLMQSTWLDETINAVVAGLNTAVYIRDLTPRARGSRRRRTVKRRKGSKTSSAGMGVRKRKRKVRRTKSRKKLAGKKQASSRGRIARSLGISKPKTSVSLPTVYRPAEHTLGTMRADIGAASLSVYGDPFDLDPFVDGEEDEQQAQVTSLLEAKRRGISHSALRSHQPVARPITASLARTGMGIPQSSGVMEAAPVPDLLGSILSGQSMLLMDSSDVVINRDGSLKANKSVSLSPVVKPGSSRDGSSGETSSQVTPGVSPNANTNSFHLHGDLPGPSCSPPSRPGSSHSSPSLHPFASSSPSRTSGRHSSPHSHPPHPGHPGLQPPNPHRPSPSPSLSHRGTNGVSTQPTSDLRARSKDAAPARSQPKKTPAKPVWVDVAVLPRIPKIKRDGSGLSHDDASQDGSGSSTNRLNRQGNGINAGARTSSSNGMPAAGMHSLAGDKGRQQSVDQQLGRAEGQPQRQRPADRAGPSSAFSNSFSSSSSSGSPASHPHLSSSSAVSFRINASGNSWHARRLSATAAPVPRGSSQDVRSAGEETRRRHQRRDKQMLLASRTLLLKEQEKSDIYDPSHPTLSESNSSDSEAESQGVDSDAQNATADGKTPALEGSKSSAQRRQSLVQVKAEPLQSEITQEQSSGLEEREKIEVKREPASAEANDGNQTTAAVANVKEEADLSEIQAEEQMVMDHANIKKEPGFADANCKKEPGFADANCKKEPGFAVVKEAERCSRNLQHPSQSPKDITTPLPHILVPVKTESSLIESGRNVQAPSSTPAIHNTDPSTTPLAFSKIKEKAEIKSEPRDSPDRSKSRCRSPVRTSSRSNKTFKGGGSPKERRSHSGSPEPGRRREQHSSGQGGTRRGGDENRERSSRRSRSRERRRQRSSSENSQSNSSERSGRKKRRSRSRSRDRRRARSSSSSREPSRRRQLKHGSKESKDGQGSDRGGVPKDKRRSRSRSRSWSRSRERRKDRTQSQPSSSRDQVEPRPKDNKRARSRSRSKERRNREGASKSSRKATGSSSFPAKETQELKCIKKEKDDSHNTLNENKDSRERSVCEVKKESTASVPEVKKEKTISVHVVKKEVNADTQLLAGAAPFREIKKEKQPVDMFDHFSTLKPIKKAEIEVEILSHSVVKNAHQEKDVKREQPVPIESETSTVVEIVAVKLEAGSQETTPPRLPTDVSLTLEDSATSRHTLVPLRETQCRTTAPTIATAKQVDLDEDFNVDMILDNLDLAVPERAEGGSPAVKQEKDLDEMKTEGGKSKSGVKRVTWNIQEPEEPQPEKSASKLALYKLKLKQEGARRPSSIQTPSLDARGVAPVSNPSSRGNLTTGPHITSCSSIGLPSEGSSRTEHTEAGGSDEGNVCRKDEQYLKKLHMQERAIEEVKLAIKPFYQNRDINKDEYKEIVRKAVQKVCHSKSGEINPAKVANLVKAYVDKYKHARKHKKDEDDGKTQTEVMTNTESP